MGKKRWIKIKRGAERKEQMVAISNMQTKSVV